MILCRLMRLGPDSHALIDLLQHPRVTLGLSDDVLAAGKAALEIGGFRGQPPVTSTDALRQAAAAIAARTAERFAPPPLARLTREDITAAEAVAKRLAAALDRLPEAHAREPQRLSAATQQLRAAMELLCADADGAGGGSGDASPGAAFDGEDGQALDVLLAEIESAAEELKGGPADLAGVCAAAASQQVVRGGGAGHPRVAILGPLEARLISADLVILGGLNEGVWPPQAATDALLNRTMRAELGLSSPERRIGQSAHDFIQALCAPEALLTRAVKSGGTPTLACRFWQRLEVLSPPEAWREALARGAELSALATRLDRPDGFAPRPRPEPRPPAEVQPRRFSVTECETLFRDPYAFYARRILGLAPLEEAGATLDGRDRGDLLHAVMERFTLAAPDALPDDPEALLLSVGEAVFAPVRGEPDVEAFWWPRFRDMIPAVIAWERHRRAGLTRIGVELRAEASLRLPDGAEITLSGRADRIEALADGRLAVIDFKTGSIPSEKQREVGLAPQLPLEAALAARAPYEGADMPALGPAAPAQALFAGLKPGAQDIKETHWPEPAELHVLAEEHLAGFLALVQQFRSGTRAFVPRFAPQFMRHAGDYDHLARVKEWSVLGDDEPDAAS
jgi:ATP-dependent helicase/nuclease subunit B